MKWYCKDRIDDEAFVKVCKSSQTMSKAAASLGLHYNTFKRRAIDLNCFFPNQCGKGVKKPITDGRKYLLWDIFSGKYPAYGSSKLKNRLFEENIKNQQCEICGCIDWCGKKISFELDHIDGNKYNNALENLRILCPNCHSQTNTFRSRKR